MATAPTLPTVSVDEYFQGGYEAEWEYVDGVLVPRRNGSLVHARMVAVLCHWMGRHESLVTAYAALVLQIPDSRYRVPDVCCYAKSVRLDPELVTVEPPLAIFEILSKSDPMMEIRRKCDDYRQIGVPNIFLLDPLNREVLIPSMGGFPSVHKEISFCVGEATIAAPLPDLFDALSS